MVSTINNNESLRTVKQLTVFVAGDSGDGMQLLGTLLANVSAQMGNDVHTFADYPAEIRAPAGSLYGVSGFQIHFSDHDVHMPGDAIDILVALNPAALKVHLDKVKPGSMLILDTESFNDKNLKHADYLNNPLEDETLSAFEIISLPITSLTQAAGENSGLTHSQLNKCKNMFLLGVLCWVLNRDDALAKKLVEEQFTKHPDIQAVNQAILQAGYDYASRETLLAARYHVNSADLPRGKYRQITGNQALALGCIAAAAQANKTLLLASYPITPASSILHELSYYQHANIKTFQAEDEIASICAAIGAAYGGNLAITTTSGPGFDLKVEALGLAAITELPLVVIDVQRAGPSTGMPTKTEQSDLLAAIYGRHGESPIPVIAPATPHECFACVLEAFKIALKYMTPVIVLSDAFLANASEPWLLPKVEELPELTFQFSHNPEQFNVSNRDPETLAREWAIPGMVGFEHRIGSLERDATLGTVSYDPKNHQRMTTLRANKVAGIAKSFKPLTVYGAERGDVLVVGWGSTYGSILTAVETLQNEGKSVSHLHLRHLFPWPENLGEILKQFKTLLVPEMNSGQLCQLLRAEFLIDAISLSNVTGKPFTVEEIKQKVIDFL